jgi:hypothetical protein
MKISIQDPAWNQSEYLLERILEASSVASRGGGAFAFASLGGVKLLLADIDFRRFLTRSPFDLVIGVDAVTTLAALDSLGECVNTHKNLNVRVFMSEAGQSLFHPKFCWFGGTQGSALVGSGNLTAGGLRGNREAFAVLPLDNKSQTEVEVQWNAWLDFNSPQLYSTNSPAARKQAAKNKESDLAFHERQTVIKEDSKGKIWVGMPTTDDASVLIAEIPKSGNRWNQANFDLDTFQNYFGADLGHTQRIILTHIDSDGVVGNEEVRPSVSVSSQNYRFELEAGAGMAYPSKKRPIGIFVRAATRTFRYRLLMPGTRSHMIAEAYLIENCPNRGRKVGRHVASRNALLLTPMNSVLAGLI